MASTRISRRAVLKGLGATAVALPLLEIMAPRRARAAPPPLRFLQCFAGVSLGRHDGELFTPATIGANYALTRGLAPLANYGGVKSQITVVSNLRIPWDTGMGVPPAGRPEKFHASAIGPEFSGVQTPTPDPIAKGPTADQIVADVLGKTTRFRSLEMRAQADGYNGAYGIPGGILSYRKNAQGVIEPNPPMASPKVAFDTLFNQVTQEKQLARDQSVLDLVLGESVRLKARLGTADRTRLERHFDEIRDLELRASSLPPPPGGNCKIPPDPGADPPVAFGYSDEHLRAQLFGDLLQLAFTCDLTRSASLMYAWVQCFMNAQQIAGINTDLHELGHSAGTLEQMTDVAAWFVDHFARLVAKFRDTPDGDGSLLDHSALVLGFEGGSGLDSESGILRSSHSTEKMAMLVAGHAGGLNKTPGRHIATAEAHPASVVLSAMHSVGVAGALGEVATDLPDLFT